MFLKIKIFIWSIIFVSTLGQFYEDKRCRCVCPSPSSVLDNSPMLPKTIYIRNIAPNKCNCYGVVLPILAEKVQGHIQLFCQRCDCKYETRNTTVIIIVVALLLGLISLLVGYFCFLMLLHYIVYKRHQQMIQCTLQDVNSVENEYLLAEDEDSDTDED